MNENYIQCDGVAMGFPLGPILADIFMSNLENKLHHFSKTKPQVWHRHVDDILCIFNSQQNITDVLKRLKRWHNNIKFTITMEKNKQISFLNVLIIKNLNDNKYEGT